jgi:DNA-binding SARP family transcriptional activator
VTADQRPLSGAAGQPRRLAVLALLAVAGDRGVSRGDFLSLLWPDNDEERGRHALNQALHALRRDLGSDDLFLGQKDIRLNPDLITSDYAEFQGALRNDSPERAVECYGGPFLQGFTVSGADTFERWTEERRDALRHEYAEALEAAAQRALGRQDQRGATGYLKKRAALDPMNARVAVKLMEALAAQGDVAAALQHARVYETLVQQELELPPDPEVTGFAERLRTRAQTPTAPPRIVTASREPVPALSSPRPPDAVVPDFRATTGWANPLRARLPDLRSVIHPRPGTGWHRWAVPGAIALLAVAAVSLALGVARHSRPPAPVAGGGPVVAIGRIVDYSKGEASGLGQPLADMLATNLGRASGFRVVSSARMLELIRQLAASGDTVGVVTSAAREAGARELVDGSVYTLAPGRFRLDLQRVDLTSGAVIRAYKVEGSDLFALVDSGTAELVRDLGGRVPEGSLAEASTGSLAAYQAYEEGLRRFYGGDNESAERLFRQALEADPEFAQAAYYYARATSSGSRTETLDRLRRAVELAQRAGDRERLVMQAEWAFQNSSPALPAIADTLMIRYPEEVDGYYYAGRGTVLNGEYLKAVAPYRKVIALDSLGLGAPAGPRCRACDAYAGLVYVFYALDSVAQSRAMIREWVRRQPTAAAAWYALAHVYAAEHQEASALTALRVADSLEPTNPMNRRNLISVRSYLGDYPEAERLLRSAMEAGPLTQRRQAQWDLAVILRQMGRLREAVTLAHDYRMNIKERLLPGAAPYSALLEAQVLFEQGNYRAAAALFDSIAVGQQGGLDLVGQYRDRIWAWVHEADARAQLRDTARLAMLADTMEVLGRSVGQARERNLHAHVRGLLARVRGRDDLALDWFRRSMVSPVVGLTRGNYEMAGIYLRTGRPVEAIRILGPAIRAGTVGPNLYITRTELEARLAEAFEAAGEPDSALTYYRTVIKAWEQSDPEFADRRQSAATATLRLQVGRAR